jgi:RimJ/RimL family protein N-acetyltransferase
MIRFNEYADAYQAVGDRYNALQDTCISNVSHTGKLLAVVRYTDYQPDWSISMHINTFGPNWATRDYFWAMFDYPFNQLHCQKVFGFTPESNQDALKLAIRLGFNLIARIPGVYPNDDALIISRLEKQRCKWLDWKPRSIRSNK